MCIIIKFKSLDMGIELSVGCYSLLGCLDPAIRQSCYAEITSVSQPSSALESIPEMVRKVQKFVARSVSAFKSSCGILSSVSFAGNMTDSPHVRFAPAIRYRRHGRIRRVVRKGGLLADNGTPVVERPSRVVGWRSGSCAGRMSADSSKYIRRCYIYLRKFVQYTEVISGNLCSMKSQTDINCCNPDAHFDVPCGNNDFYLTQFPGNSDIVLTLIYASRDATYQSSEGRADISLRAEINMRSIRYTKRKLRDDFFAKGRLSAEVARKAVAERTKAKKDG